MTLVVAGATLARRDAGDKLPASGRPLAGRELVAAGQAADRLTESTVRSTISLTHAGELIKATSALHGRRHNLSRSVGRQSATLTNSVAQTTSLNSQQWSLVTVLSVVCIQCIASRRRIYVKSYEVNVSYHYQVMSVLFNLVVNRPNCRVMTKKKLAQSRLYLCQEIDDAFM